MVDGVIMGFDVDSTDDEVDGIDNVTDEGVFDVVDGGELMIDGVDVELDVNVNNDGLEGVDLTVEDLAVEDLAVEDKDVTELAVDELAVEDFTVEDKDVTELVEDKDVDVDEDELAVEEGKDWEDDDNDDNSTKIGEYGLDVGDFGDFGDLLFFGDKVSTGDEIEVTTLFSIIVEVEDDEDERFDLGKVLFFGSLL